MFPVHFQSTYCPRSLRSRDRLAVNGRNGRTVRRVKRTVRAVREGHKECEDCEGGTREL